MTTELRPPEPEDRPDDDVDPMTTQNDRDLVMATIRETVANLARLEELTQPIVEVADRLAAVIAAGGTIMFCGNGGSAADCQHLAAELEGRFLIDRRPLPAMALTVNSSSLTAIGNDYGFDQVFARQLRAHGTARDALVGISTSGNSPNVIEALVAAREIGMVTVGLTGAGGGKMPSLCDLCLKVPSSSTPHIQVMHIHVGHMICQLIERKAT